jgi:eukaryotic-like serine/threonine-protein kinase
VLRAFEYEANLLRRCSHPGIPRFGARFAERGHELLCMERVEGPTLEQVLTSRGGPCREAEVAQWGRQICDILLCLHRQQPAVVFRDLKPANLMLDLHGRVRLIDFGIACEPYYESPLPVPCYGTPGYAAPEQYRGLQEPSSDIYGLGATLYQLLTACDPQVPGFDFVPLRERRADSTPPMEALLAECLQPDPQARPRDVAEVAARLALLAREPEPTLRERILAWWRDLLPPA